MSLISKLAVYIDKKSRGTEHIICVMCVNVNGILSQSAVVVAQP